MPFRPFRSLASFALALIVLAPGAAAAQFTTFTAHPTRVDTVRTPAVALTDSAKRARADSANGASIANMKSWVDSAAVAAGSQVPAPLDSTTTVTTTQSSTTVADAGMRAPNTASPLPTLLAGGAALLLVGLALRRRRA